LPVSHAALVMLCFESCPSELGTRGAADLPRSTAELRDAAERGISKKCDGTVKPRAFPNADKLLEAGGVSVDDPLSGLICESQAHLTVPISEPAYFATGSDNRDDEKIMLNELVPTEACRNSSSAGTSLFWSSVVRYSRIL
jgi:hypothetical protein